LIGSAVARLLSGNTDVGGVVTGRQIRLNQYSGIFWFSAGTDPYESIWIDARWGYAGIWQDATTLSAGVSPSDTTIQVTSPTSIQIGDVIKLVDSSGNVEYCYIYNVAVDGSGVQTNPVNVVRAYNDSSNPTALTIPNGAPVQYWVAEQTVQQLVMRLTQFYFEQIKEPLSGQATLGDLTFPVSVNGLPADLFRSVLDLALVQGVGGKGV
jgi:hypothetical protein